jgi:hypothetical protein
MKPKSEPNIIYVPIALFEVKNGREDAAILSLHIVDKKI